VNFEFEISFAFNKFKSNCSAFSFQVKRSSLRANMKAERNENEKEKLTG
jgi:hypothetical protein